MDEGWRGPAGAARPPLKPHETAVPAAGSSSPAEPSYQVGRPTGRMACTEYTENSETVVPIAIDNFKLDQIRYEDQTIT